MSSAASTATENASRAVVEYSVDADGRIDFVAIDAWNRFALANGAPELTAVEDVLGTPLESFISGELALLLYQRMFERLRRGRVVQVEYVFRCDAPAIERDLRLTVVARFHGSLFAGLLFRSVELETRPRPSVAMLERHRDAVDLSVPLLRMCSYCKDVFDARDGGWHHPDDYLRTGGKLDVRVSHGACPRCFEGVMRTLD